MIIDLFNGLVVQPIFNLLVFIYAILPGHNFGLAIILFTILIRIILWPVLKRQLHHTKAMRKLQPEIKRIKKASSGDRKKESAMLMELYKERGISPFGPLGIILIQFVILIGLYLGLSHVIKDPKAIIDNSYSFLHNLSWMKELGSNIGKFDNSLFGLMDLSRPALNKGGGIYWPAMLLVLGSAATQFYQSSQLIPKKNDSRGLRQILRDASTGKESDQSEVQDAMMRNMRYIFPVMIIVLTVNLAAALSLYWLVGGLVACLQQARILSQDEEEMEVIADKADDKPAKSNKRDRSQAVEAEIVEKKSPSTPKPKKSKSSSSKKRRKR